MATTLTVYLSVHSLTVNILIVCIHIATFFQKLKLTFYSNNEFFRLVDPRIDIVKAEWHPFKSSSWLMSLMVDLSDWRAKLDDIEASLDNDTYTNVVFLADFPGMKKEE